MGIRKDSLNPPPITNGDYGVFKILNNGRRINSMGGSGPRGERGGGGVDLEMEVSHPF